jgi:hypothetical protein
MSKQIIITVNYIVGEPGSDLHQPNVGIKFTGGEWNDTDIVGILRGMYIHQAEKFLKTHPCKDCNAFIHHQLTIEAMNGVDVLRGFDNSVK